MLIYHTVCTPTNYLIFEIDGENKGYWKYWILMRFPIFLDLLSLFYKWGIKIHLSVFSKLIKLIDSEAGNSSIYMILYLVCFPLIFAVYQTIMWS